MTPAEEMTAAAERLRDVAPDITGPLAGLADPVADWLEAYAKGLVATTHPDWQSTVGFLPLAVARKVNGGTASEPSGDKGS